ncbi:MAG: DUF1566 domain-containing protein [Cytophagales bacterium]|nr:DUF1566 domain-containing protein [Cytophagales bacterium]
MGTKMKGKKMILALLCLINPLLLLISCAEETSDPVDRDESKIQTELPDISGYPIVGTDQTAFYDHRSAISSTSVGDDFYGQNANYPGNVPKYADNQDGTVTDLVTGLMWTQSSDLNGDGNITATDKLTYSEAVSKAGAITTGGYDDWRLPTIKELYSLIIFSGVDPSGYDGSTSGLVPFISTVYFDFEYGDERAGERIIDSQFATSTIYVGTTMGGNTTMFGVNFADGRIKGYPVGNMMGPNGEKEYFTLYVRGNTDYGINRFHDNGDGTITDEATGLMWMQNDNGAGIVWEDALKYAESHEFAGYSDWRLPDAKELQSIVDYTRSPSTSNSPAIDPLFNCSEITVETGEKDYPFYWSSTTHANMSMYAGGGAAYVCFGSALGNMNGSWIDVHGAGAQRSDPKTGDPGDYPTGHGPQGDAIRIYNYARLVRNIN